MAYFAKGLEIENNCIQTKLKQILKVDEKGIIPKITIVSGAEWPCKSIIEKGHPMTGWKYWDN